MVRTWQLSTQRVSLQAIPPSLEATLESVLRSCPASELPRELSVSGLGVYSDALPAMLPGWCGLWLMDLEEGDGPVVAEGPRGERMAAGRLGGELCAALANEAGTEVLLLCGQEEPGRLQDLVLPLLLAAIQPGA